MTSWTLISLQVVMKSINGKEKENDGEKNEKENKDVLYGITASSRAKCLKCSA